MLAKIGIGLSIAFGMSAWGASASHLTPRLTPSPAPTFPPIASMLRARVLKGVIEDREIATHADLKDPEDSAEPEIRNYSFYSAMQVGGSATRARRVLGNYDLFAKMIPYVSVSRFNPALKELTIKGGIFGFKMSSVAKIAEYGERTIAFEVIRGHFKGLQGRIQFESLGERGALIYIVGKSRGTQWPPAFVVERGAEIVFGFAGQRMRSYIESNEGNKSAGGGKDDPGTPRVRNHRS